MSLDSLAHIKTRSPFKVSIAFALGIILPSGFLGYLGLRSYQYEGQLMQKETQERYAVVADLFEQKVISQFSELQSEIRSLANQPAFQHLDIAELSPILLRPPVLGHLSPKKLFVFDETNAMVAPWYEEEALRAPESHRRDLDWGVYADEVNRLEQLEFAQKDFSNALHGYTALQSRHLTASQQAALLKNIAGDYRQLHQNNMAINTYLKLAHQYDALADFTGVPMGLIGRRMAIDLYTENEDWSNALDARLDVFQGLLFHQWKLTPTQRKSLLSDFHQSIDRLISAHPAIVRSHQERWTNLQSLNVRLEILEREAEAFRKSEWPALLRRMHQQGKFDQGTILQAPKPSLDSIAVIVPILTPEKNQRRGFVVALFSPSALWGPINALVAEVAGPAGLQVVWEHAPEESVAKKILWKPRLQRDVAIIDPPLHFEFRDLSSNREQAFRQRQWIFGGMIGLSFVVIIVGLFFTSQAVKRETEVANLKSSIVANVSHELRTPLSVIYHIGEKLGTGRFRSETERQEIYTLLRQQTGRLREVIDDVLDISKIMAGKQKYRKDALDLIVITLESISAFEPRAEARGFWVSPEFPPEPVPIEGDARALRQAILNLLDNAMKYSGDSHALEIQVSKTGETATVAITDHGIGISESDKEKIFETFYRIDAAGSAPDAGGVGLGLAMVKHVIEGHGGRIQVESKVGQGSTFSLIFPLGLGGSHG